MDPLYFCAGFGLVMSAALATIGAAHHDSSVFWLGLAAVGVGLAALQPIR
jgi:hypothetical protein